jgi:hypothetical protein
VGTLRGGGCDVFGNLIWVNRLLNECNTIPALGSVESMCSRVLEITTIEPHPTRDRVDVGMCRCPIHGDIWRSIVLNQVEAADMEIATLLPP